VSPSDLVSSTYGLIVLAKVAGMLVLIAFGANHRKRVLPALRDSNGGDRLVLLLKRELAVFAIVVLIGGLLAYVPPAVQASVVDSTSHTSGQ
jgi:putative copper resistance protein D